MCVGGTYYGSGLWLCACVRHGRQGMTWYVSEGRGWVGQVLGWGGGYARVGTCVTVPK